MTPSRAARATLASVLALAQAAAWGPLGHQTVAEIAMRHLGETARREAAQLLEAGESLASVAVWADQVRPQRPASAPWHYINLPVDVRRGDYRQYCPDEGCVISAMLRFQAVLHDPAAGRAARSEALKFLVHFTGDLHQPLHSGDRQDRGGNDVAVVFFAKPANLHSIWDSDIPERALADDPGWREKLLRRAAPSELARLQRGRVEDWAWEAHDESRRAAYAPLPAARPAPLGAAYQKQAARVVARQLRRAGLRLARLLDEVWAAGRP